jgi:hypothetical protein
MWNGWLGKNPPRQTRGMELIVGGEEAIPEETYVRRLSSAMTASLHMLRRDRWISVVFQHWNTAYFSAILSAAAECGADLRSAVSQVGDPIWSMHKKKSSQSVLAGEMILTFLKTGKANREQRAGSFDLEAWTKKALAPLAGRRVFGEYLLNQMIIEAWKKRAIHSLNVTKHDFSDLLQRNGWKYDAPSHSWIQHSGQGGLFEES